MRYLIKNMTKEKEEFEKWCKQKQSLNNSTQKPHFREGEIRWAYIGKNIDSEIFGKGTHFTRPVLILKKLYSHSCYIIPLTSKVKNGDYYFNLNDSRGNKYCAILSQIRYVDGARIGGKKGQSLKNEFSNLKSIVRKIFK